MMSARGGGGQRRQGWMGVLRGADNLQCISQLRRCTSDADVGANISQLDTGNRFVNRIGFYLRVGVGGRVNKV